MRRACIFTYEGARVSYPRVVDCERIRVGDGAPDTVHCVALRHVKAEDERGGHDAPRCLRLRMVAQCDTVSDESWRGNSSLFHGRMAL